MLTYKYAHISLYINIYIIHKHTASHNIHIYSHAHISTTTHHTHIHSYTYTSQLHIPHTHTQIHTASPSSCLTVTLRSSVRIGSWWIQSPYFGYHLILTEIMTLEIILHPNSLIMRSWEALRGNIQSFTAAEVLSTGALCVLWGSQNTGLTSCLCRYMLIHCVQLICFSRTFVSPLHH